MPCLIVLELDSEVASLFSSSLTMAPLLVPSGRDLLDSLSLFVDYRGRLDRADIMMLFGRYKPLPPAPS